MNRFLKSLMIAAVITLFVYGADVVYAMDVSKVLTTPGLKQAWIFLEVNDYKRAEEALNECYMNTTETGAACNFIYARILDRQKNPLGAIEAYRKSYTRSTNASIREEALFRKSELFFERRYYYEALAGFRQFARLFPNAKNTEKAYLYLAKSLDLTKNQPEALEAYEKAGDSSAALYGKANMLQRLGKSKEAQEAYDKAVRQDAGYMEKNEETYVLYGENLFQTGNIPKAKEVFQQITDNKTATDDRTIYDNKTRTVTKPDKNLKDKVNLALGVIEASGSNDKDAVKYLTMAAKSRNTDVKTKALLQLAGIQLASEQLAEARKSLDALKRLSVSGKDREDKDMLSFALLLKEKDYKEAVKVLKSMFAKQPDSKELMQKLETVLNDAVQTDKEQFIALWDDNGNKLMDAAHEKLILQAAEVLKERGGKPYRDVLEWILRHSSDEERQKALYALSEYYADIGDKVTAVKYLGLLKRFKVPADDILRSEAKVLYENNDLKGVYEKLTAMKHLKKEDIPMLRDTVSVAVDKEKALAFYQQAMKGLGGETGDAMTMAENLYLIGKKDEAVYYYKQVLAKDPSDEWALYRTGMILGGAEGKEALKKLSEGKSQLSKFARSIIQGDSINKSLEDLQ